MLNLPKRARRRTQVKQRKAHFYQTSGLKKKCYHCLKFENTNLWISRIGCDAVFDESRMGRACVLPSKSSQSLLQKRHTAVNSRLFVGSAFVGLKPPKLVLAVC